MKIKTTLTVLMTLFASTTFAKHHFNVCLYNQTDTKIPYNNEGISKKWLSRGELVGAGLLNAKEHKCFHNIEDETIFSLDYITFTVAGKWLGIVNSGFKKPYLITQDAVATKGGQIPHYIIKGKDYYNLNIHIMNATGEMIYSANDDYTVANEHITPRKFK